MIKDITEDLILVGLLLLAVFLVWKYYLKAALLSGAEAAKQAAANYFEDVKTVSHPLDGVRDIVAGLTAPKYISQEEFRANIEKIKRNLAGKQ